MYDEFFGIEESEQYAFYRVPKLLFTSKRFWHLSTDAKMLYGLFLDRMALSQRNGWIDEQNRGEFILSTQWRTLWNLLAVEIRKQFSFFLS